MYKTGDLIDCIVSHLNGEAIGVAYTDGDKKIFIAGVLPGEKVRAKLTKVNSKLILANLVSIIEKSPERVAPPCEYYDKCGGCNLQHCSQDLYLDFKKQILSSALNRAGYTDFVIDDPVIVGERKRRRVSLKLKSINKNVELGFYQRDSHSIVNIDDCLLLHPDLSEMLDPIKKLFSSIEDIEAEIVITKTDNGLDIVIKSYAHIDNLMLIEFCQSHTKIIRFSCQDRVVYGKDTPIIRFGKSSIVIPLNAFLQATEPSQTMLTEFVLKHTTKNSKVIDLYAGCGTYSFPLSDVCAKIHAVDGNEPMLNSIKKYATPNLSTELRDLFKNPVIKKELQSYDLVVINPPRNGASPQVKEIASSMIKGIVMISCDVNSLSNDLKILYQAGYKLKEISAIDQFYFSHHLEVAVFLSLVN